MLSKMLPKVYGDKITQEHTGSNGGPIALAAVDLKNLSDAELAPVHGICEVLELELTCDEAYKLHQGRSLFGGVCPLKRIGGWRVDCGIECPRLPEIARDCGRIECPRRQEQASHR
jgi:hypothetical protein